jgi:ABC-type sugar transport system substrate-binding protein
MENLLRVVALSSIASGPSGNALGFLGMLNFKLQWLAGYLAKKVMAENGRVVIMVQWPAIEDAPLGKPSPISSPAFIV